MTLDTQIQLDSADTKIRLGNSGACLALAVATRLCCMMMGQVAANTKLTVQGDFYSSHRQCVDLLNVA